MPLTRASLIDYVTNGIVDPPIGKSYQPKFGPYKISLHDLSDDALQDIRREITNDRWSARSNRRRNKLVLATTRDVAGASPDDALPLTQEAAEARRRAA